MADVGSSDLVDVLDQCVDGLLRVVLVRSDDGRGTAMYFFFQAEDGIRDIGVTGVQTCALPIYATPVGNERRSPTPRRDGLTRRDDGRGDRVVGARRGRRGRRGLRGRVRGGRTGRCEARRVGEACRSRWAPYH